MLYLIRLDCYLFLLVRNIDAKSVQNFQLLRYTLDIQYISNMNIYIFDYFNIIALAQNIFRI